MAKEYGEQAFKSGSMKGKTYKQALETEEGRGKLRFLTNQPIPNDAEEGLKYWILGRNKWIKENLEIYQSDPELSESPSLEQTAMSVLGNQVADHEQRIKKLEEWNQ